MKHDKDMNNNPQKRPHDKAGMAEGTDFATHKNYKANANDFTAKDMDRAKKKGGKSKSRGETMAEKLARIAKKN